MKKMEKDIKKSVAVLEDERVAATKHKQVAIMLIKERKRLMDKMLEMQHKNVQLEHSLRDERTRQMGSMDGGLLEAALEKQLSEFDIEREQFKARLSREEGQSAEYKAELEHLRQQVDMLQKQLGSDRRGDGPQSIEIKSMTRTSKDSGQSQLPPSKVPQPTSKFKGTPPSTPPETRRSMQEAPDWNTNLSHPTHHPPLLKTGAVDSNIKRAMQQFGDTHGTGGKGSRTAGDKPVPADKPADLATSRINVIGPGGAVLSTPSAGTTVFTTPSGTRISLNVGPSSSSNLPRKPAGRGAPPPVPPNKPTYVPPSAPGKSGVRLGATTTPPGKPQPPNKYGITISKDKISISHPENPNDSTRPLSGQRPVLSMGQDGTPVRKPSQVCGHSK